MLATLRRSGPPYRLRPTEFASALMLTSSGTTKRLDRLEQAGLITRAPDPDDRRGDADHAHRRRPRADRRRRPRRTWTNERSLLGALTAAERRRLADLLRKLLPRGQRGAVTPQFTP